MPTYRKGLLAGLRPEIRLVEDVQQLFLAMIRTYAFSGVAFYYLSTTLLEMSNWCQSKEKSGVYKRPTDEEQEYIIDSVALFLKDIDEAVEIAATSRQKWS